MLPVLLLLFILIPVLELSLMIHVGGVIGTWNTVGLVIFTAVVGGSLVRSQGLETLHNVRAKLANGETPGKEIVEGMMLAIAGVFLVLPGFITDFIGLLFLTPITRAPIAAFMFKRMRVNMVNQGQFNQSGHNPFSSNGSGPNDHNTFEGDFERKSEEVKPEHRIDDKDNSER
ncbi:FxsA family protein [Parashewanella spongiae]|uniref:FxsA family protein n=1 Tax=Parashewanella spongiae TaxID=342950 RepID=A0A3A6TLX6_9GAMM|nr:FxsA family protein [Parashewanella spongiae]MCL1078532.1 FxsA family protein [Parashewanella spongiae]RJY13450.1 FxsA family protein [Parashewanella spongiae]